MEVEREKTLGGGEGAGEAYLRSRGGGGASRWGVGRTGRAHRSYYAGVKAEEEDAAS